MTIELDHLARWSELLCTLPPLDLTQAMHALGIAGSIVLRSRTLAVVEPAPVGTSWLALSLNHLGANAGYLGSIQVVPAGPITRHDLDRRFGAGVELPPICGGGGVERVAYDVRVAGAPCSCTVTAEFRGEPTVVYTLRLRRDAANSPAGRSTTVGVFSLNVGGLPSALPPVRERAVEFCRRIEESGADIVNLQEVWTPRLLDFIRARLPSFGSIAWRAGVAGRPAGGLVSFSRLPLAGVAFISFRGVRPHAGTPLFRGMKALNSRLQGVLIFEVGERRTLVGNVHLSANRDGDWSTDNRHHAFQRAQLLALHDALRQARNAETEMLILSGDLNIPSTTALYPLVVDGDTWRDPFAAADQPTFHAQLLPPGRIPRRIDYLLVSGDARRYPVTEAATLFAEPVSLPDGRRMFLSDHLALTIRLPLPPTPPSTRLSA